MVTALPSDRATLEEMLSALTERVRQSAPSATSQLAESSNGYFCASWRLHDRAERELFVERVGADISPLVLRVGVYLADSVALCRMEAARARAFDALVRIRPRLQDLGVFLTFTVGSTTRDDRKFSWTDGDVMNWLTMPSENRDLVRIWDLKLGLPPLGDIEDSLDALVPVWLTWNELA